MSRFIREEQLDFDDVMIVPKPSTIESRKDANIIRPYTFKWSGKTIEGNPGMASNMDSTGTFEMAKVLQQHKMFCALSKHYSAEEIVSFLRQNKETFGNNDYIFVSTGLRKDDFDKLKSIMATGLCNNICLDAPNGYITGFVQHLNRIRHSFPRAVIMAGNVVTPEKTDEIIKNGADIVKVGIGSGQACKTRVVAGVGRPQLSAVIDCADAARNQKGMICSDGGIQKPADYVKAIAGYADFVMMGGYLAGCSEAGGKLVKRLVTSSDCDGHGDTVFKEKLFKLFYGMSSQFAQDKHYNGMNKYRASEGLVTFVPFTGPVEDRVQELEGGLRSAMTYTNARTIQQFQDNADFFQVRRQVARVSGAKDKD